MSMPYLPPEYRLASLAQPDNVTIRCQRTWHSVTTINRHLNGSDIAACIALIESSDDLFSCWAEAYRLKGTNE